MTILQQQPKSTEYDEERFGQTEEEAAQELAYLNERYARVDLAKKLFPDEYENYKQSELRIAREILQEAEGL